MDYRRQMLEMDSIRHEQIKLILAHYGEYAQRVKAVEELAELQCEILHNTSDDVSNVTEKYDSIVSEVADVYVMLEQVLKIYNLLPGDIHERIKEKLRRTEDRIAAERGSK